MIDRQIQKCLPKFAGRSLRKETHLSANQLGIVQLRVIILPPKGFKVRFVRQAKEHSLAAWDYVRSVGLELIVRKPCRPVGIRSGVPVVVPPDSNAIDLCMVVANQIP